MKRFFITVLAAVSFSGLMAQTQARAHVLELTLEDAIEIALNENPIIKVADLEIERQDYVRKETVGNLLPNLSATGSYTRSIVHQKMSRDGFSFGADNSVTGTATLSLPLFVPAVYEMLKMNRTQMEAAVEAARSSKIDMVNEVKKTYYSILLAKQSLEVLMEAEKMLQETIENIRTMYRNNLASEYDLLTAEVELSNLQPTIIQTKNSIDMAKMLLRMYLSLPQDLDVKVTGHLDDYSDAILNGGQQYTTDISDNSDLRNLDIQKQLLNHQIKIINTQRMPTIAAFGSATIAGNDMPELNFSSMMGGGDGGSFLDPSFIMKYPKIMAGLAPVADELPGFISDIMGGGGNTEPKTGFWWQTPVSAGIQISVPIFTGNKNVNQVRQTRNTISQVELQRDYLEESLRLQAQSSINNIFTAREKMRANEAAAKTAQKAYDISKVRYNAGMGTILELNSSQLSLTQAQLNYSQAIYDYLAAEADYEKTIGREYEYMR